MKKVRVLGRSVIDITHDLLQVHYSHYNMIDHVRVGPSNTETQIAMNVC